VIISIKREPLATDIIDEQTFNVGKTDEIAQRIVPLRALRSLSLRARMTAPVLDLAPNPQLRIYFKLEGMVR
jgi:hypothetical protein